MQLTDDTLVTYQEAGFNGQKRTVTWAEIVREEILESEGMLEFFTIDAPLITNHYSCDQSSCGHDCQAEIAQEWQTLPERFARYVEHQWNNFGSSKGLNDLLDGRVETIESN
ncbi:hypothetical protein BK816_02685 [Boudabousia tangfeifanii]|uniref:Uncharacterized protein n=1 Tax=Boudabousia tangfeifanii TaxID=1912795 RepID=A0A1D9MJI4_9ACTO|nr:hypothetical protein [Boudabousia tangfeifanii]AOZ72340.1 hypothetical protein BK816_02685 [Boudabousia tangfeifanii]